MPEEAIEEHPAKILYQDDLHLEAAVIRKAKKSFKFFFKTIFRTSIEIIDGYYVHGKHIDEWCDDLQNHKRTCRIAPRKHLKTTVLLGYCAWKLFKVDEQSRGMVYEILYMSYSDGLAGEKVKLLKSYISCNPYFNHIVDLKPTADTILEYANGTKIFQLRASGIFGAMRGKHPHCVIVDDPLKDPDQTLNISVIEKVGKQFFRKIASLPKEGTGEIHVSGTPQDASDLLYQLKANKHYRWRIYPAIKNYKTKEVFWPELFPFERLIDIRDNELGPIAFEPEYQCKPRRSTDLFINEMCYDRCTDDSLKCVDIGTEVLQFDGNLYAGMDLGKKRHPSHIAVFEARLEADNRIVLYQIYEKWLDHWEYSEQIELCKQICDVLPIQRFIYDNTRSEFEGYAERGELPACMEPVVLTRQTKYKMAAEIDKAINNVTIKFIKDERQKRQTMNIDKDLQSFESADGHGDSFWSNAFAVYASLDTELKIEFI